MSGILMLLFLRKMENNDGGSAVFEAIVEFMPGDYAIGLMVDPLEDFYHRLAGLFV